MCVCVCVCVCVRACVCVCVCVNNVLRISFLENSMTTFTCTFKTSVNTKNREFRLGNFRNVFVKHNLETKRNFDV